MNTTERHVWLYIWADEVSDATIDVAEPLIAQAWADSPLNDEGLTAHEVEFDAVAAEGIALITPRQRAMLAELALLTVHTHTE